jgi:hypothetical protein
MLDRLHEREQQKKRMKLDGTRRFRRAYIEQGKGNGKSPSAGGIGTITRRNALLRTAALASVGMIPAAPVPGIAAPPRQSARSEEIDRALQLRTAPIDYDTALA